MLEEAMCCSPFAYLKYKNKGKVIQHVATSGLHSAED